MDKCYFLSGRRAHFHRYCDSSFRNKWTGFWIGRRKFLDYFAFNIDGEWLSPSNIESFSFFGNKAVSTYRTHVGPVEETVEMTDGELMSVSIKSGAREATVELGINIRDKSENWHNRSYELISGKNTFTFMSIDKISVKFDHRAELFDTFYKNHMENQRCMVAKFKVNGSFRMSIYRDYKQIKIRRKFPDTILGMAAQSLDMLIKSDGMYAGLPWFLETWGRDLGWTLPALIDLKWFKKAKRLIRMTLKISNGRVPNFMNPTDYFSADATPLMIMSIKKYVDITKDTSVVDKEKFSEFIDFYERNRNVLGFFENDKGEMYDERRGSTWMDTLHRPIAVEVQALWLKALKDLEELGFSVDYERLERNFERLFWNGKYYDDFLGDRTPTPNMLVPIILGLSSHPNEVINFVEKNLTDKYGVLTLPKGDPRFSFSNYHRGQIWSLTTGWMTIAEYMYGKRGDDYLRMLARTQRVCYPGVGETFDDRGNVLGCKVQAWGSAMIVRSILEFNPALKNAKYV